MIFPLMFILLTSMHLYFILLYKEYVLNFEIFNTFDFSRYLCREENIRENILEMNKILVIEIILQSINIKINESSLVLQCDNMIVTQR